MAKNPNKETEAPSVGGNTTDGNPTTPVGSTDWVGDWQEIETAPKGRSISLWVPDIECWLPMPWTGSWSYLGNHWQICLPFRVEGKPAMCEAHPTHWMELPEPPTNKVTHGTNESEQTI